MQDPTIRAAIRVLGTSLGPDVLQQCRSLFTPAQAPFAAAMQPVAADVAYGPHVRHRLDLYAPVGVTSRAPVLVFVHGGGFVGGSKRSPDDPFNAHVGRWAARNGFLGVVMNYRLAPDSTWPSGGEDVGAVVDWAKRHAADHGGDPERIVLMGTSAGSVHVGTYLQLRPGAREIRGAVLLSGLYGVTPMERSDPLYFGDDAAAYTARASLNAIATSAVPLLVASAEFDPPRFQAEFVALLQAVHRARGWLPRAHYASGHNHYTMAMHVGTSDTRLADEVLAFARECFG